MQRLPLGPWFDYCICLAIHGLAIVVTSKLSDMLGTPKNGWRFRASPVKHYAAEDAPVGLEGEASTEFAYERARRK